MASIRIITGLLKGRGIPFSNEKFNKAEITPQKIKGAVFSSIGEFLEGKVFIDLFACSGQMGIEALSRGAFAVFNDFDRKKTDFIKLFLDKAGLVENFQIFNLHADRALRYISNKGISADFIFLDPPYIKEKEVFGYYKDLLLVVEKSAILKETGVVIIQHYAKNKMEENFSGFTKLDTKIYGTSAVSYYII